MGVPVVSSVWRSGWGVQPRGRHDQWPQEVQCKNYMRAEKLTECQTAWHRQQMVESQERMLWLPRGETAVSLKRWDLCGKHEG